MPGYTTEGIILKRKNFGEADRVVTALTERFGKISIIARGVRKITSRRAGNIEVCNRAKLHLFKARNYTLTEAESIETFQPLKDNLSLATAAFHILELIDRLTVEGQKHEGLYFLTLDALHHLEKKPRQIFLRAFEVKILANLGFWSVEALKNIPEDINKLLEKLEFSSFDQIEKIVVKEQVALMLSGILRGFIEKILESGLKSVEVTRQLKKSN